jgi:hypothetical protein
MTRFLSDSLQAQEPYFRQSLADLEKSNSSPNIDIRFSLEVMNKSRDKLKLLGLDPKDTTPEELYYLLQEKVKIDDAKLTKTLRTLAATHISAEADVVAGMVHALKQLPDSKRCFAIKASSFKTLIRMTPPKKAMRQLGFRSLDSFLKHESAASIMAAAKLFESSGWHRHLVDSYKRLDSRDFEDRSILIEELSGENWKKIAETVVKTNRNNLLAFKELGALLFLKLPADVPAGSVTASLALGLHELNEIRASGSYLKLCQVRPDFGRLIQTVAASEPRLNYQLMNSPLPWNLVQRYYVRLKQFRGNVFEPHLQLEDVTWHPIEKAIAAIEPSLAFWEEGSFLAILKDKKPVSFNLIDSALNCCNGVAFEHRIARFFQRSLWNELLLRYLSPEHIEQTINRELQPQMVEAV